MSEKPIGESAQDFGNTTQLSGSVGTTSALVPSVAGDPIAFLFIRCPEQVNIKRLLWSLDDITYHTLSPGEFVGWPLKGDIKQIYLKGSVASVLYEVILNREPT